jgi:histidinol-phosphatase
MALERELEVAKQVAQEAGALALDYSRRGVTAESKQDESPVTAADRACEKLIVQTLCREFPDDGVIGEEGANQESKNGRKWIIDPIDGTKDFVRGIPFWSILIGLEENGRIVAGAAYCPGQNELLWAARGLGAWANNTRIRVSTKSSPSDSILSFNGFNKVGVQALQPALLPWVAKFWAVRSLGGSMDAILLSQGKADVWIEPNAAPWDLAPLKILVEEAGGVFRSFSGTDTIYEGNAYACTPGLENTVKDLLRQAGVAQHPTK